MTQKSKNTRNRRTNDTIHEWHYFEGPPIRPWQWYPTVIGIAIGIGLLIYLPLRDSFAPLLSMLLWATLVIGAAGPR